MTLRFIIVLPLAWSNSLFLHCFSLSVFLFLLFDMDNGGAFISALLLLSVLHHCLQFGFASIWLGKSRCCTCAGEGHCPVHAVWGRRAAGSVCMRVIDTSQTLSLALIGCFEPGGVDSCKSNYSHRVEPKAVDFYTADLFLILLSDHTDNI